MRLLLLLFLPLVSVHAEITYLQPEAYLDVVNGKMIYGKIIGIENDIIVSIENKAPAGKKVTRFRDMFFTPGLIDCHTHILFTQLKDDVSYENALVRELKVSESERMTRAKKFLGQYLKNGFTSVCDLGNSGKFLDVKLKNEIKKDSNFPDLFVSGPGIATSKGQFSESTASSDAEKEYTLVNKETDLELVLKSYSQYDVDILKIYIDNSPGSGSMDSEMVKRFFNSKSFKKFKKVTFHALEKQSVDLLLGLNQNISIEHGNNTEWSNMHPGQQIYLTLTDLPVDTLKEFNYYNQVFYMGQILRAKKAYSKGISLVFGTDFYFHKDTKEFDRGRYAINTIDAWKAAGIPALEIIRAMTINPAKSLGIEKSLGVIKVGAKANLIGMMSDPIKEIDSLKKVQIVINKGKLINRL